MGIRTTVAAVLFATLPISILWMIREQPAVKAAVLYQSATPEDVFYRSRVEPILQANCLRCHGGMNHRGGLSMTSRESLLKGGRSGPAVVPGHPEQSLLMQLVRQTNLSPEQKPMPLKGKLSAEDISTLEEWIRTGAAMPPVQ